MIVNKLNHEEFLEEVLEALKLKGFDVSEDSNITTILSSIIKTNTDNINDVNEIVNKLSFDGRSGALLDELYGFFGIPRMVKSTKDVSFTFLNNGTNSLILNPNTLIEFENNIYRITSTQYVSPNETKTIYAVPMQSNISLAELHITLGKFRITTRNISVDNINEVYKNDYLERNVLISNFNITLDKESDLEYKSRAQGLIQHFGDSNITKIRNYIMGIDNVSDVKIDRDFNSINITAIPTEIQYVNQINEQIKEAADYFSSAKIEVLNPSITELRVSGLTEQLVEWGNTLGNKINEYLIGVNRYLDEYAKDLFLNKISVITRDSIEFTINKYFADNNIIFTVDEDLLEVEYAIFTEENYLEPIIVNKISRRRSKDIKTDIVIFGEVK